MTGQVILTIVGVVVGVGVAEWAFRVRERRRSIERGTQELALLIPHVVAALDEAVEDAPIDTGIDSPWWERRERMNALLLAIGIDARRPLRRHKEIKREARNLTAQVSAMEFDWFTQQKRLPHAAIYEITGIELMNAVFGKGEHLDAEIQWYQDHGYTSGRPPGLQP